MNELIKDLGLLINATLIATPPLLLAALGSCFSERSGVVNIGIEGMMTIGAFTGAVMGLTTGNGWIAFLCAGLAGDLTIYGRRDRVAVIREKDGKRMILMHDLRSSDIFNSPCYYLQQNDIVYVEPNKAKAEQTDINQNKSLGVWFGAISALVSIASLIVTLTK